MDGVRELRRVRASSLISDEQRLYMEEVVKSDFDIDPQKKSAALWSKDGLLASR